MLPIIFGLAVSAFAAGAPASTALSQCAAGTCPVWENGPGDATVVAGGAGLTDRAGFSLSGPAAGRESYSRNRGVPSVHNTGADKEGDAFYRTMKFWVYWGIVAGCAGVGFALLGGPIGSGLVGALMGVCAGIAVATMIGKACRALHLFGL